MVKIVAHRDCLNYAPLDVVKGICHRTKQTVGADEPSCNTLIKMPKCKHCGHFCADEKAHEIGRCGASKAEPKFMAYPDMIARSCEHYVDSNK